MKKETLVQVFSCGFCKISKNNFFKEHLWMTASVFKFMVALIRRKYLTESWSLQRND